MLTSYKNKETGQIVTAISAYEIMQSLKYNPGVLSQNIVAACTLDEGTVTRGQYMYVMINTVPHRVSADHIIIVEANVLSIANGYDFMQKHEIIKLV